MVGAPMTVDEWLEEFGSLWLPDRAKALRELFEEAESVRGRDTATRGVRCPENAVLGFVRADSAPRLPWARGEDLGVQQWGAGTAILSRPSRVGRLLGRCLSDPQVPPWRPLDLCRTPWPGRGGPRLTSCPTKKTPPPPIIGRPRWRGHPALISYVKLV